VLSSENTAVSKILMFSLWQLSKMKQHTLMASQ